MPCAPCSIGQRVAFNHAYTAGLTVQEYEPRGKASGEIKELYAYIAKEMGYKMSSKKKGLAETFIENEERLQQTEQTEQPVPVPQPDPEPKPKANTRVGKRHIGGYFDKDVWAQLKIMSVEKGGVTLQEMLADALNNYFIVNDKPPIAK